MCVSAWTEKKHRRNLNILVCGGSGAGKTRFFCKPNAMQCNTSFVVLDPKGEIVRDIGGLLESKGYEVRVLDLINMHRSHCYNPFVYLRNDNDVQRLVTNLFKATTPKGCTVARPVLGYGGKYAASGVGVLSQIRSTARGTELPDGYGAAYGQAKSVRTTTAM